MDRLKLASLPQAVFGQTGQENGSAPTPSAFGAMASFLVPKLSVGLTGNLPTERSSNSIDQTKLLKKEKHTVRPPVKHNWSLPGSSMHLKPPQIFQHELIQNFSFNMFCKVQGTVEFLPTMSIFGLKNSYLIWLLIFNHINFFTAISLSLSSKHVLWNYCRFL